MDVPYNTMHSDDNFKLYHSSDDSAVEEDPLVQVDVASGDTPLTFDMNLLKVLPFRLEAMKYFPFKSREGETPVKLLKV